MENAAKALLIAGEVLLGIIVLSLMTMFFNKMLQLSQSYQTRAETQKINAFNMGFIEYITSNNTGVDKQYLTPEEVITLVNKVDSWNHSTEDSTEKIALTVRGSGVTYSDRDASQTALINFLKTNKKYQEAMEGSGTIEEIHYKCELSYNVNSGRITGVIIEEIT